MKSPISVEVFISASPEKAWQCWTEPEHITKWTFASDDWQAPRAENDLQVGGTFSTRMEARDGSAGFDFGGTYTVVEALERIEYTMSGEDERKVCIEFLSEEGGTRVRETFEAESENSLEMQKTGWQAILENFKKHVEAE